MSTPTPISYPNKAKELRQRLLGAQARPPVPFKVKSGATYWAKKPTIEQRGLILERAGMVIEKDGGSRPTPLLMVRISAQAALLLVVDEEGRQVFEESDLPAILSADGESELGEVASVAASMMGEGITEGEASGEAPASASPTSSPTVSG